MAAKLRLESSWPNAAVAASRLTVIAAIVVRMAGLLLRAKRTSSMVIRRSTLVEDAQRARARAVVDRFFLSRR
jgi:hypothetical protein